MILVLGLSVVLMFAAITLLAWNVLPRRGGAMAIRGIATQRDDVSKLPSAMFKMLFPLLDMLAPLMRLVQWKTFRQKATLDLQKAGIGQVITVDHLLAFKVLSAVVTPFIL